ncbi:MAG: hypothetical protein JOZ26_25245 [Hyphomicrobiales bacterium]|nr:hypothetical protein [Hyphomicrobiales bacterium]
MARLRVLEACLEALTAENEILKHRLEFLKRRLAAAETRTAQETEKARWAIAQFSALTRNFRGTSPAHGCGRAGGAGGGED